MFLPFEVRLLTFLHLSTCNTLEDFVGCLFWALVLVFKNFQMGCASCVLFLLLGYIESLLFSVCFSFCHLYIIKYHIESFVRLFLFIKITPGPQHGSRAWFLVKK
jgi:hypothetical protein